MTRCARPASRGRPLRRLPAPRPSRLRACWYGGPTRSRASSAGRVRVPELHAEQRARRSRRRLRRAATDRAHAPLVLALRAKFVDPPGPGDLVAESRVKRASSPVSQRRREARQRLRPPARPRRAISRGWRRLQDRGHAEQRARVRQASSATRRSAEREDGAGAELHGGALPRPLIGAREGCALKALTLAHAQLLRKLARASRRQGRAKLRAGAGAAVYLVEPPHRKPPTHDDGRCAARSAGLHKPRLCRRGVEA